MTPAEVEAARPIPPLPGQTAIPLPGRPCGTPSGPHTGLVRLYPCGWRCAQHTPSATAGEPEPPTTPNGAQR